MAKSRIAAALVVAMLWTPTGLLAQNVAPADPQALIDAQRAELADGARIGCRRSADPAEITVCGTREETRYRVPDIVEQGVAPASTRAGGEQLSALNNDRCLRLCAEPVRANIFAVIGSIARAIERLRDDE